jgi:polyhydroxyalkanoate synthesis regulator phasin
MNESREARRLERVLIDDDRTHELGVQVLAVGDRIVAHGEVASEERRQRVLEVLREAAPDHQVEDQLTLSAEPVERPSGQETLPAPGARSAAERPPGQDGA